MIVTNRRKFLVTSAALVVGALTLSAVPSQAFSPRSVDGVTATSIKLGITIPMSGTASPGYNKIPGAMKAYFDYVNDNGGVNGRKVTLVVENDEYVPTKAVTKTNKLVLRDKVLALVGPLGTSNNQAVAQKVNPGKRGVPVLFVNSGFSGFANKAKYPTTYTVLPSYIMEAKIMSAYIKEKFAGKKLGLLYQDDDFGDDALAGFKQSGVDFAVKVPYASGSQGVATTPGTWVSALAKGGAEVVVLFGVSSATAAALYASYVGKYKPQWILGSVGGDATTLAASKIPPSFLAGAIGTSFAPSPADATDDYIKLFMDVNTKYNAGVPFDNNIVQGMNTAFLTVQALKSAGKNLTRKSLMAAIDKNGSKFASAGLVPLNYSATSHVGYNGYWFGTYNASGALVADGGKYTVYTTDSGSGAVAKSTYTRPAMPAKGLPN